MADATRQAFEKPNVLTWTGQINITETLAANLRLRNFDSALIANHTAVLHAFVFAAETLPISNGSKDTRAKETITLRLEGSIVNRLWLCHFTVLPLPDFFRRRQ